MEYIDYLNPKSQFKEEFIFRILNERKNAMLKMKRIFPVIIVEKEDFAEGTEFICQNPYHKKDFLGTLFGLKLYSEWIPMPR